MISVDTSVLVAILLQEDDGPRYRETLRDNPPIMMSAVLMLKAGMILQARHGQDGLDTLRNLIVDASIQVMAFDRVQADGAIEAFARYGKGMNPASRLNFGDCASYALATSLNIPLLYKGDDFSHTDVLKVTV